jgi:hypothetical protein
MTVAPTHQEKIDAIRAVRLAAHELANVCAAIVGGTQMAVSMPTVGTLGEPVDGIKPGGRHEH